MINLLPPSQKNDIIYARRNVFLLKWNIAMVLAIVGVAAVIFVGTAFIDQSNQDYAQVATQAENNIKHQHLEETQKQAEGVSNSFKLVVQVLSREVLFSKLLQQIGAAMPSGAILTQLSINKVQGGINLTAAATDYQTATQVQVNLQDPNNKIFDQADIDSVSCSKNANEAGEADKDALIANYPCRVALRALFAPNNPFSFISTKEAKP